MVFVGGYWPARREAREEVAERIATFLSLISEYESFVAWFLRAKTSTEAHLLVAPTSGWLAPRLRENKADVSGDTIQELGFSMTMYNSADLPWQAAVSLRMHIGSFSPNVDNSVVLSFGAMTKGKIPQRSLKGVLNDIVSAFDPAHAVVTSHERMDRAGVSRPWEAGLLTYERGGVVKENGVGKIGKYEELLVNDE